MIYLSLALTLSWRVPQYTDRPQQFVGYVPRESRVYRHVQSQTWLGMSAAMKAMPEVWAAYWPKVVAEAAPVRVATIPLDVHDAGRRVTWSVRDTSVTTFWFVTTVDTAGRESRISNEAGK